MTLADKIILLDKGRIAQFGTPLEIYNEPKNTFVARFIGSPKINLIEARVISVQGNEVDLETSLGHKVTLPLQRFGSTPPAGKFTLGIRPEHLRMQPQPGDLAIDLSVSMIESLGESSCIYGVLADGSEFVLKLQGQESLENGVRITAHVTPGEVLLFDDKGGLTTP
jgi:ABC-type sugar transport system ATPase subunit